jgi:hypothetical protein
MENKFDIGDFKPPEMLFGVCPALDRMRYIR